MEAFSREKVLLQGEGIGNRNPVLPSAEEHSNKGSILYSLTKRCMQTEENLCVVPGDIEECPRTIH